jgi:hypothetical protein
MSQQVSPRGAFLGYLIRRMQFLGKATPAGGEILDHLEESRGDARFLVDARDRRCAVADRPKRS